MAKWFVENNFGDVAVLKVYRTPSWLYSHMTLICRILGPAVMVAMWALTVTAFMTLYPGSGVYLLFLALLLIFQELSWVFSRIEYLRRDNCLGTCWRMFVWFDSWKRAIEYLVFGIIAFIIGGFSVWPLFVAGALMLLLFIAYILKAIRFTKIEPLKAAGDLSSPGFTGVATAPPPSTQWGDQYGKY